MQSHPHFVRSAGTINAVDIISYLKSRHGISVSEEIVNCYLLIDLAGQIQDNVNHKLEDILEDSGSNADDKIDCEKHKKSKGNEKCSDELTGFLDICQLTSILLIPELLKESEGGDIQIFGPFRTAVENAMNGE